MKNNSPETPFTERSHTERMIDFIHSKGGKVPFDFFMAENLYGQRGFYTEHAEIKKGGHFTTEALRPELAILIAAYLNKRQELGPDFLELGGGTGQFKDSVLNLAPGIRYLSVDISPKHARMQRAIRSPEPGEILDTVIASACAVPFADKSINGAIFAHELLDNMPCRVFKIRLNAAGEPNMEEELFIHAQGTDLKGIYAKPTEDEFYKKYNAFLKNIQSFRRLEDGEVISASAFHEMLIKELDRVLNSGSIILIDYGYDELTQSKYSLSMQSSERAIPYFVKGDTRGGIDEMLSLPYQTDITYGVDFLYCKYIATRECENFRASVIPRPEFCAAVLKDCPEIEEAAKGLGFDFDRLVDSKLAFGVLEIRRTKQ